MRSCKSLGASLGVVTVSTFWTFLVHGPLQTFTMWPGLPQLKQRLLQGSFFTGLVWSRSMGWGAGGTVVAEGLEKEEDVAAVGVRSEEHTSELQSHSDLVCRLLLEKKKKKY